MKENIQRTIPGDLVVTPYLDHPMLVISHVRGFITVLRSDRGRTCHRVYNADNFVFTAIYKRETTT